MRVSTKGRYGLRMMEELATNYEKGYLSLSEISRAQNISERYLEQIVILLKKSGLIDSMRGTKGGYCLNSPPNTISVGKILRALEGDLSPVYCVDNNKKKKCEHKKNCKTTKLWENLKNHVDKFVDEITLADVSKY